MGRIRCKAAAVFCFIDTVTQVPVSGGRLRIQIRQRSPVVCKDDGYVVVLGQPGVDSLDIVVSASGFSPAAFHVNLVQEAPVRVQYVYLLPSWGYPFTPRMAVIRGSGAARSLYAVRAADCGRYKLLENLEAGESVMRLWGIEKFLRGQRLLLEEEGQYALATLLEPCGGTGHAYRILGQSSMCFRKGKTKVYSVTCIFPDENGRFCVAYDRVCKGGETIRFWDGDNRAPGADAGTDIKIEIQEGQEIEIHVGG